MLLPKNVRSYFLLRMEFHIIIKGSVEINCSGLKQILNYYISRDLKPHTTFFNQSLHVQKAKSHLGAVQLLLHLKRT